MPVARRRLPSPAPPRPCGDSAARPGPGDALTSPLHPRARPPGPRVPLRAAAAANQRVGRGPQGRGRCHPHRHRHRHRIAPRGSASCRRPPPTAERCALRTGHGHGHGIAGRDGRHRAGRGSPAAPHGALAEGGTGAAPGWRCRPSWPRRGRGVAGGSGMRIPEGPAGRGGCGRWPFCGAPRCSRLCVWGLCPRVPTAVTAGCRPIFQKDPAGVGGGRVGVFVLPADEETPRIPARVPGGENTIPAAHGGGHRNPCHPRGTPALPSGADGCGDAAEASCVITIMLQS